jgi:hypothetical protein
MRIIDCVPKTSLFPPICVHRRDAILQQQHGIRDAEHGQVPASALSARAASRTVDDRSDARSEAGDAHCPHSIHNRTNE